VLFDLYNVIIYLSKGEMLKIKIMNVKYMGKKEEEA
jgi:hypothetical protein